MTRAYLGIGSNIGDTKKHIEDSIEMLRNNKKIEVIKISSKYETEPIGYTDQDWFLNVVVEIKTELEPYELLKYCNYIEDELKRKRIIRWGPRTIDVDVLLYGDYTSDDEKLTIPHPRMTERAFVMIPLYEIAKDIKVNGEDIKTIVDRLEDQEIKKL
ncbi:2-amino-4-hydroxy-6-hydroxymethyldihydropteridine diphosphokinase [Dethiothermospora halolimnae]|uniref:2-amino-4-hydroxy-6- hydroxymethyldihydropteridine diphosphokinase n=1 Tax=Dethiothermospora halolimnae TaxID=3114390 RepID=UPI003CCC3742